MREFLLICCLIGAGGLGYYIMSNVGRYLDENGPIGFPDEGMTEAGDGEENRYSSADETEQSGGYGQGKGTA